MKNILVTGASGVIGSILVPALKNGYDIYTIDRKQNKDKKHLSVDISNLQLLDKVFEKIPQMDTVVHLAADPNPEASWESILVNNIIGTRNIFESAKKFGVKKIIYASSNRVTHGYENQDITIENVDSRSLTFNDPIRPNSYYAISKVFGEAIAWMFYDLYDIHSICLRIGTVTSSDNPTINARMRKTWLSHRDLIQLVKKAIETNVRFGIYYGVSNNNGRPWDISNAEKELDYHPIDNSDEFMK